MVTKPRKAPEGAKPADDPSVRTPTLPDKLVQIDDSEHVEPLNPPRIGDYLADAELGEPDNPNIIITEDDEVPAEFRHVDTFDDVDPLPGEMPGRVPDAGAHPSYPESYTAAMNAMTAQQRAKRANEGANYLPPQSALPDLKNVRYEGRVRIIEAWRFTGVITEAPAYVDRNWLAYGGYDEERGINPGPMIQMPQTDEHGHRSGPDRYCRIGDYIVQQEIRLDAGQKSHIKVEVWPRDEFEKVFIIVPSDEPELQLEAPPKNQGQAA